MSKFLTGFKFAWAGVRYLFRSQRNAKVHLAVAIGVIAAGCLFGISQIEWCLIVLCIALVFAAEGVNTAIESLADAVHPGQNPLVGKAKDVAAGAVLLCAIAAAIVGAVIFLPRMGIGL
ncbi:MAG: diacylglycerol kinase (ATP) [Verrucomicrobiales bacterium]|jgi:diacylglycerol kinase (ATP)